jgi:RNA polymerase-binding protein DksA
VSPSASSRSNASPKKGGRAAKKPARPKAARKPPRKPAPPPSAPVKPRLKGPFARKELTQFREALLGLRSHRIGDKESREKEALKAAGQDVSVDHMADFGTDNYEQEFTLGILEQDVETLRDINDALTRIQDGSFGLCEECEKPIARARLKALPYARLCVDCKMKEE